METSFTPWLSLGGGIMVGALAVLLMAADVRFSGISGRSGINSLTSRLFARSTDGQTGTLIFVPFMPGGMRLARQTPDFSRSLSEGALR